MPTPPFIPKTTRDISRLKGYGENFGKKSLDYALRLFKADSMKKDRASDTLSMVYLKLFSDPSLEGKLKGKPLSYAENYVYLTIKSVAIDEMRKNTVRYHTDIDRITHEPSSWGHFSDIIPVEEQDDLIRDLEKSVNLKTFPDIVEYFKLLLTGHTTQEIANKNLLPSLRDKPMSQQGLRRYEDVVKGVLERHFGV